MRPLNTNVIPLQAAGPATSLPIICDQLFYVSVQAVCTGAAGGTMKLQASNDFPVNGVAPVNFTDIPGASVTITGAGSFLIPKTELSYQYVQVVYTNTGSGTISARAKFIGA